MARTHVLKLQKDFCDAVYNGEKLFELRYNDRGFQRGDLIRFVAMDGEEKIEHPINDCEYVITYVLAGWGLQRNFVALSIWDTAYEVKRYGRPTEEQIRAMSEAIRT